MIDCDFSNQNCKSGQTDLAYEYFMTTSARTMTAYGKGRFLGYLDKCNTTNPGVVRVVDYNTLPYGDQD